MKSLQIISVFTLVSIAMAQTWIIETVDSTDAGKYTSLALDSSDNPRIAYLDSANSNLKYAVWTGSQWEIETVDSTGTVGAYTSLALDSSDCPHISCYGPTEILKYAYWNGSSWEIESVDTLPELTPSTSLALDSSDFPHISYAYYVYGFYSALKYAHWNGSSWEIEIVDSGVGYTVLHSYSLALDSSDNPHVSYFDSADDYLKYALWNGYSWEIEVVDAPGITASYTSLVLDSSDNPHIAYGAGLPSGMKYAHWNGSSWDIEAVDSNCWVFGVSLALDSSENPHISYCDFDLKDLKYALWNGTSWEIVTVDSAGVVGRSPSLAIDSADNPHISYADWTNFHYIMKYARQTGTGTAGGSTVKPSVFPNPFAADLNISFSLPEPAQVSLSVYDLTGRLIDGLVSGSLPAGNHTSVWKPDITFPDGCYLIVLDTCGERAVRRCVLLR